jgi:hypothetical protein
VPSRRHGLVGATLATCLVAGVGAVVVRAAHAAPAVPTSATAPSSHGSTTWRRTDLRADRDAGRSVGRLGRLTPPDVLVSLPRAASPSLVSRVRHHPGVAAVAVLDRGTVHLASGPLDLVGADVAAVRAFTPRFTAVSVPLWRSVAAGELTLSYAAAARRGETLGATDDVRRAGVVAPVRIGAFASLGIGHAQGLVDRETARRLALPRARAILVSAPRLTLDRLRADVRSVFGAAVVVHVLRPRAVPTFTLSAFARATIPPTYLALYRAAAATCPGLPWTVLAAIGAVETGHGADTRTSTKGAMGPMQFLPSTFVAYAVDGNGDGVADIQNPADAVYSAARYLCLWGAGRGGQSLVDAIWAYNHADWYVREVIRLAIAYG